MAIILPPEIRLELVGQGWLSDNPLPEEFQEQLIYTVAFASIGPIPAGAADEIVATLRRVGSQILSITSEAAGLAISFIPTVGRLAAQALKAVATLVLPIGTFVVIERLLNPPPPPTVTPQDLDQHALDQAKRGVSTGREPAGLSMPILVALLVAVVLLVD